MDDEKTTNVALTWEELAYAVAAIDFTLDTVGDRMSERDKGIMSRVRDRIQLEGLKMTPPDNANELVKNKLAEIKARKH